MGVKRHSRPLSFRAWEAVNKLKEDLTYRTPKGHPMKHVVLRRDLAAALLSTVQRHYGSNGAAHRKRADRGARQAKHRRVRLS
jgi:hypothetical protein